MRTQDMLDEGAERQAGRGCASRYAAHRRAPRRSYRPSPSSRITPTCSPPDPGDQALLALTRELDFDLVGRTTALGEAIPCWPASTPTPPVPPPLLLITDGRNTAGNAEP